MKCGRRDSRSDSVVGNVGHLYSACCGTGYQFVDRSMRMLRVNRLKRTVRGAVAMPNEINFDKTSDASE
jgi:hypothetical protein